MTVSDEPIHFFSRGADSLVIDLSMHQNNRAKLLDVLGATGCPADALIFSGGSELPVYNSDTVWDFKQESNIQYLFGVKEPGCTGLIALDSRKSYLFIPRLPKEYAQWMGEIKSPEWFMRTYVVDDVFFIDEMEKVMSKELNVEFLHWYDFSNHDSGSALPRPSFPGSSNFKFVDGPLMAHALNEIRLVKSAAEVEILQYTNDVSCRAHIETLREIFSQRLAVMGMEHFAETNFRYHSGLGGCARVGYHCIACSGINNAILHYGHAGEPNNKRVAGLLDMSAEYHCYTADVTVTFPTSGKFSQDL
jgi:Xaa-Pro dipeptidase